jgi:hypothetical protein
MKNVGCDLRAREQTIAMLDTETGEFAAKSRHFVRKAPCRILSGQSHKLLANGELSE